MGQIALTTGDRKMLKTVRFSTAKKTLGLAVTYRAGNKEKFGTCPVDCKLNDSGKGCEWNKVDKEYLDAVLAAKPEEGQSFTYSHFDPFFWAHKLRADKDRKRTRLNSSHVRTSRMPSSA